MAYEEEVFSLMSHLVISDKHVISSLMSHRWQEGASSVNNAYKALTNLVGMGKLEKGDGFFRLHGCKSEYKEHAQLLTQALARIIKLNLPYKIYREHTIQSVSLRPDAIVLIHKKPKGLCFILEVVNYETEEYLTKKINAWAHWEKGLWYLSGLFGIEIPCFDIVVAGTDLKAQFQFKKYLEEVANG
jgi:hypothetical protein